MRDARKKIARFFDRHIEHVVDVFALVRYVERFFVKALSAADVALNIHVGQKIHFNDDSSRALTIFAPAAFYVKTKASGFITFGFSFRKRRIQIADAVKYAYISCRIRARRSADGTLVYVNNFVDILQAVDCFVRAYRQRSAH